MSSIRPMQTGQTIAGLVRQANPNLSDAEVIQLTRQILGQTQMAAQNTQSQPTLSPQALLGIPVLPDPLGLLGPMAKPQPAPPPPKEEPKGPLEMLASGAAAVFEGAGKGLGSVLEGAGKAAGNLLGGLFAPPEPPKPALPLVTPENLFQVPAFPQQAGEQRPQGIIVIPPQQNVNAQTLAGLSPDQARQLAITGNIPTSRAFTLSGQQFLPFANPNIVLRNINGAGGVPPQQ